LGGAVETVKAVAEPACRRQATALQRKSGRYIFTEKRKMVMEWKGLLGNNVVDGKPGWFGESGKCCVSKQNA